MHINGITKSLHNIYKTFKDTYDITIVTEMRGISFFNEKEKQSIIYIEDFKPIKYDIGISFDACNRKGFKVIDKYCKVKIVFIHQDYYLALKSNINKYIKICKNDYHLLDFDKIIFVAKEHKEFFNNTFPEYDKNNTIWCPNLIDGDEILKLSKEKILDFNKKKFTFIYLARLEEFQKRISRMFNAIKKLNNDGYSDLFEVLFIGDGSIITNRQIPKDITNIYFLGKKENPYPYIEISDCLLMSSDFEAFPTTWLEALVLKKFILTTNVSSSDFIKNNNYGIVVEKEAEELYKAMKQIILKEININKSNNFDYIQYNNNIINILINIFEK